MADPGHVDRPVVLLSPAPRTLDQLFGPETLADLRAEFDVVVLDHEEQVDAHLADAFAIVGQPALPRERLDRAPRLQALLNVEGNFLPNVDYAACFERGIRVLGCGPAFAQPVAEHCLAVALDLCRGITREDRAFRAGVERYGPDSSADAVLLRGADIGLIGFGNLGRALVPLLEPFRPTIHVHDPWLPDRALQEHGLVPASLPDLLARSRVVFVLATVTPESTRLLGPAELDRLPSGARLVLASRAAVVDLDALLDRVEAGRLLAAIDVWPEEPVPGDHRARRVEGLVLSAHRAGGIPAAFRAIGDMVLDDLRSLAAGLPPVRMQAAAPELVGRYRNRPVS
jgi:phosphoglycerate dehydrogenase-like enzyme